MSSTRPAGVLKLQAEPGAPGALRMVLWGELPSKKNRMNGRGGKGFDKFYDPKTSAALRSLETQARVQWGPRKPVLHPALDFHLFIKNQAKDPDGVYTTLLDVLKKAGVIADDSIKFCNGPKTLHPVTLVDATGERAEIVINGAQLAAGSSIDDEEATLG